MVKKWLDSIEKQNRRSNLKDRHDRQRDIQTDRQKILRLLDYVRRQ